MGKDCVRKTVLILGIFELLSSIILVVCGIFGIVYQSVLFFVSHGIWGGAWLALTAIFAITAGCRKSKGFHITHMVFAILSCVIILPVLKALFVIQLSQDSINYRQRYWCTNCYSYDITGSTIFELVALVFCGLLFVILIISASFTCCAVCKCCGANVTTSVVYPMSFPHTQGTTVVTYGIPIENTTNPSIQMQIQTPRPTALYPNVVYPNSNDDTLPPPYGQPTFSAYMLGQQHNDPHQKPVKEEDQV